MKRYKSDAKKRAYARNYYYNHREKLLNYVKSRYIKKGDGKCKCCGKDLSNMPNGLYKYCNECINDNSKVSRQARWYRRNNSKLRIKNKKGGVK